MATPRFDLVVIGAGIAGLSLALASARRGLRVKVVERDPDKHFRRQGFNLVLSDWSGQALADACGVPDMRTKYDYCCDADPWGWLPLTAHIRASSLLSRFLRGFGAVRRGEFRDDLLARCEQAGVSIAFGTALESLEQSPDHVTCRFGAQPETQARVVAGCDGVNSWTRNLTLPALKARKCGAVCIRGAAPDDGSLHALASAPRCKSLLLFVSCCPGAGFNATCFGGTITWVLEIDAALAATGLHAAITQRCGQWHPVFPRLMLELTPAESLYVETLQEAPVTTITHTCFSRLLQETTDPYRDWPSLTAGLGRRDGVQGERPRDAARGRGASGDLDR